MSHVLALPHGTVLAEDYEIERVLGAGGFGITYLARERALDRLVTIKEYFPADFAHRRDTAEAVPRSEGVREDYQWGLDRFISEAQTLARFDHANIVKVYRYFRANSTGYMVLHFEEGQSLKGWLKSLGRAPRQRELDQFLAPLLDALEVIHTADFLHRDIAPDNIIIRKDGSPVLIDFGSARGEIAQHSRTLSALVKPGYSPYEQYAETGHRQGPWTDIYALAATLYHAITGKRPQDAPSRIVKDDLPPSREVALSSYRARFLAAIDRALALDIDKRPISVRVWRGELLAPDPKPERGGWLKRTAKPDDDGAMARTRPLGSVLPPVPDAPGQHGGFLDFVDGLKKGATPAATAAADGEIKSKTAPAIGATPPGLLARIADVANDAVPPAAKSSAPAVTEALRPAPSVLRRKLPKPKPVRTGRSLRPLVFKLAIGAAIASVVVAVQDRLTHAPTPPAVAVAPPAKAPVREARANPAAKTDIATASIETRSLQNPASPPTAVPSSPTASAAVVLRPPTSAASPSAPAAAVHFAAHRGAALSAQFVEDGRSIATLGSDRLVRTFVLATGTSQRSIALGEAGTALAVAGRRAAVGHADGTVSVWDVETGDRAFALGRSGPAVTALVFSGAARLAVGAADGTITLWNLDDAARPVHVFEGHTGPVRTLAAHPSATLLVSGSADQTARTWDLGRLSAQRTLRGQRGEITAVGYAPDGRTVAAASSDGSIRLWNPGAGRVMRVLRGPKGAVTALAYSPAGDLLATAWDDGTVRLSGTQRWRTLESLSLPGSSPRSVAFSPDGRLVATAASDGSVNAWSAIIGRAKDTAE